MSKLQIRCVNACLSGQHVAYNSLLLLSTLQVFACVVGQKPSKARFYVNDVNEVVELLAKMAGVPVPPRVDSFSA